MRILMMIHRLADNSPYCFYVHEQAKALRAQGHDVTVISCVGTMPMMKALRPALYETDRRTPKEAVIDGVPVYFPRCLTLGNAGEKLLGVLGEVHPAVAENFKFKTRAYVAEMNLNVLDESATNVGDVKDMPRFPAVQRDFAFVMKEEMPVGDVMNEMKAVAGELCEEVHLFDIYRGVPIQPGEKSVALSITLRAADRTLGEEEITAISEKIIANVSAKFGAQLRS